jgi:galactokinase/mevalonate kinase-like predicted kinase
MYGGSVISISTRERARCALTPAERLRVTSSGETADLDELRDLSLRGDKLDIARAALQWFSIRPEEARFSLEITTEIPMQAGMAGSTALIVAVVGALDRFHGWKLHPWAIAETARKVENRVMGVVCGLQDQHMAVFGGLNYMDFAGKERLEQRDDEPLATIEPLAGHAPAPPLLAAHTGVKHHSGTVHKSPRERWLAGEPLVVESYRRIASLARLGKRALLDGDWPRLGALMNENHEIVAELGGSGPANDRLIQAARAAGAYGAKLAGAGGGGTILVLTDALDRVGRALLDAGADSLMTPEATPGLTVISNE